MALINYVGAVVLEIDGTEYECIDLSVKHNSGNKAVKTMNRKGRALGRSKGIETWELSLTVPIPEGDERDWDEVIEGAKVSVYPVSGNGKRTSYLDCFSTEDSEDYSTENEARVKISLVALDKLKE